MDLNLELLQSPHSAPNPQFLGPSGPPSCVLCTWYPGPSISAATLGVPTWTLATSLGCRRFLSCCNKLPPMWQLETAKCFLSVLEAGSPKLRLVPSRGVRGRVMPCPRPCCWWTHHPVSVSVVTWPSSWVSVSSQGVLLSVGLCPNLPLLIQTLVISFGVHPKPRMSSPQYS